MFGANNSISVKRLLASNVDHKQVYDSNYALTGVVCYIENSDPRVAVMFEGENAFDVYLCVTDSLQDIRIGDLIVDKDSNEYIASGVQTFKNNNDADNHTEITMLKRYPNA